MSIVTVQVGLGTSPSQLGDDRIAPASSVLSSSYVDPEEQARRLQAEIEHHRTALDKLLDQRRRHVFQLHTAGWKLAPIGRLYELTRERARQLVVSMASASTDSEVEA